MTLLAVALCVLAVVAIAYTAARIAKEPRKATHGLLIVFSIVVTWIAAMVTSMSVDADGEQPLLIAYGPIVGGIMLLVAGFTVPMGMILVQLVGFTAYAILY